MKACAHLTQNTYSNIFAFDRGEEFASLVTSEGDEMQIVTARDASELVRHEEERRAHPLRKTKRKG